MEKLPFNSFDFWGYLSSGFLLLCGIDNAAALGLLSRKDWTIVEGILAVCVAYVAGHVIASLSSLILERGLVGRVLGWPSTLLFESSSIRMGLRHLAGFYFSPLPCQTQQAALAKAAACGIEGPGEALFWLAFAKARGLDRTMTRLDAFLNQYSFCRNVAMALLIDSAALWWAYSLPGGKPQQLLLARVAAVVGFALVARYLKFLRHYALELFTSFAHADAVGLTDGPTAMEGRTLGTRRA